jgi:hypothetical protein
VKAQKKFSPLFEYYFFECEVFFKNFFLPARTLQKQTKTRATWRHSKERNARLFTSLSLSLSREEEGKNNSGLFISLVSPAFERRAIFLSLPRREILSFFSKRLLPHHREKEREKAQHTHFFKKVPHRAFDDE